jgi:hypothetical protein
VRAQASFDHRPAYLDYEGPVSGGRGTVTRWDAGSFTWEADDPDRVTVRLAGGRWSGLAALVRQATGEWSLTVAGEGVKGAEFTPSPP